jgi:hypothetical protein
MQQEKRTNHLSYGNNCKPRCDDGQAEMSLNELSEKVI